MILNKNFTLFIIGLILSLLGTQIQSVTIAWYLYEITNSAKVLGYVGLAYFLPVFIFSLIGGYVVDHANRKIILIVTNIICAISCFLHALGVFYNFPTWFFFIPMVLIGITRSFSGPARSSMNTELVKEDELVKAIPIWSATFSTSSLIGPAIGGFLITLTNGAFIPLIIAGILNLSLVLFFYFISYKSKHKTHYNNLNSFISNFTEGIKYVRENKIILSAMTLDLFAVLFGGAVALLPIYAKDILKVGPIGFGWLQAAPAVGAFVLATLSSKFKFFNHDGKTLLLSVVAFGISTIIFGFSTNFIVSLTALFFIGFFDNISVIIRGVLVQSLTPNDKRGRVSAINGLFINASNELGRFESGFVASMSSPVFSVVSGGIGTLIVVGVVAIFSTALRNYKIFPK